MSYLLFMDESGHDHKNMPLEVRGGVAIQLQKLWAFQQDWRNLEFRCFGTRLAEFNKEPKGCSLLDKKRFKFAEQQTPLKKEEIAPEARAFLEAGRLKLAPTAKGMKAYGLACLQLVDGVFELLKKHDAKIFATTIPKGMTAKQNPMKETHLRKDHAFLIERFFYYLDTNKNNGMLVLDETDRTDDRRFIERIGAYFALTSKGRMRAKRVFPIPFFVGSDMVVGVQAADIVLYCINWGFRSATGLANIESRKEIRDRYERHLSNLQWMGDVSLPDTGLVSVRGIVHIPDPFTSRAAKQ